MGLDDPDGGVPDAFELSLLDAAETSLVPVHRLEATSFFNVNPGDDVSLAPGVSFDGTTVTLDISALTPGTEATLHIDLIGNPPGSSSVAAIDNVAVVPDFIAANTFTIVPLEGPFTSTGGLEIGDVDGDGSNDIVITDPDANLTVVFNGDQSFGFTRDPIDVSALGQGPLGVVIGPLTPGDEVDDLAITLVDSDLVISPLTSDVKGPVVSFVDPVSGALLTSPPTSITVAFDEPVQDLGPTTDGSVTNPGSYSLVGAGPDGVFDTADDLAIPIDAVTYDDTTFMAVLAIAASAQPLVSDEYRISVEGDDSVRSIRDLVGNQLDGNQDATSTFTLNLPPEISNPDVPPSEEGSLATFTADFINSLTSDTNTAVIDWGDGSSSLATINTVDGVGTINGNHTYSDNGVYLVTATVTDSIGQTASIQTTATVTNAAPQVIAGGDLSGIEGSAVSGTLASFSDAGFTSLTAGTEETFSAVVDWGDRIGS